MLHKTIPSKLDASVNYLIKHGQSVLECRYVRRAPHYVSAYLSSHNGCRMGCKFCWLTATKQTTMKPAAIEDYVVQLRKVLSTPHLMDAGAPSRANLNFMARGEPLLNPAVIRDYSNLHDALKRVVTDEFGIQEMKINISTIMPTSMRNKSLVLDVFRDRPVHLYYSAYLGCEPLKRQWMPQALDWEHALDKLADFHIVTKLPIAFHWAFIEGFNDSEEKLALLLEGIRAREFGATKFNLVRFNAPPSSGMREPSEARLQELFKFVQSYMNDTELRKKSTIIDRVGVDCYASCGMFANVGCDE